jgi:hypothetical protein
MSQTPPILRGEPLDFIFATSDETGFKCGCACHANLSENMVIISVDSNAFGSLVIRIVNDRPKHFREAKALPIAIDAVEGAVREVFQDFYEPLAELASRHDTERLAFYAMNEAAMELLLMSMHGSVVYLSAKAEAIAEMKVEAELAKTQRDAKKIKNEV